MRGVEHARTVEQLLRDRYRILHSLGAGSGGQVYKALQASTGQTVAVKLLSLEDFDGDVQQRRVERFRREIAICSGLYHPDIVRLVDSGELENGAHFAVFEYIPGKTLAEVLREEGMLKVQRARSLMMQLLPPLAYAHSKGIAHRDLKPTNIMVTTDGARDRLKILDFGISIATGRQHAELRRLTLSQEWVGTPGYTAPEQLRGDSAGPKSDLYAWGLVFLECLTGACVVTGRSLAEVLEQQLSPSPHALPPILAQHRLGILLSRVLEKDPLRRPSDANMVLSLMERVSTEHLEDGQGYLRDAWKEGSRLRPPLVLSDTLTGSSQPSYVEQRHVTVVCCRISPTEESGIAKIEQLDAMLEDASALACEVMEQFGASPAQSLGGYSIWYFGLSQARDADARLAIRASLDIVHRLEKMPSGLGEPGLNVRVQLGIHNGPVMVQSSTGNRRPIDGVTARHALRLASLGETDDPRVPLILVSDDFRQLVSRYADFEGHEGISLRVPWRATGTSVHRLAGESRSTSMRSAAAIFVGREAELRALLDLWHGTRASTGTAVLICGEPGIGKSRLASEVMYRLGAEGIECLEVRCLPECQNAFLRPLGELFVRLLNIAGLGGVEAALRLEHRIAELGLKAAEAMPLFCIWLSLPIPDGYMPLAWSPQKQRQLLHELLADALIACMERGAALLVEDLHWADPSTLECLDTLLQRASARSTFVLMTTRPGQRVSWSIELQTVMLTGLGESAVRELATTLMPASSPADLAQIVERSDGVPLYVEELAIALRPAMHPVQSTAQESSGQSPGTAGVPASLRDLLTSRLDEIGQARETAQFAAALGREFSLELLAALSEKDEFALIGDLEELVGAELVLKRLRVESPVYFFRHALIRDAAYDSMQTQTRQRTHERIALGMEVTFPALVETQPDILAHHWEEAGDVQRALRYWRLAAQRSNMASAHLEALSQVDRALTLLHKTPPSAARTALEAELLLTRAATRVAKRGFCDPEAMRSFERVAALVPAAGDTLQSAFTARWGLWYAHNAGANLRNARVLSNELRTIAAKATDSALTVSAWESVCETSFCTGNLEESITASRRCEAAYEFERHRHLASIRGDDPHLASLSFEAFAELLRGRPELALQRNQQGLLLADRLEYPSLKAGMHGQSAWLYLLWGASGAVEPNLTLAREHAGHAIRISAEHGFPFWEAYGRIVDAAARIVSGELAAVEELRQGSEMWRAAGASLGRCWHLTFIAQALGRAGQHRSALAVLDEALRFCDEHDARYFEPEVRRQRAEVLSDSNNSERNIEAALEECTIAADTARKYGAAWWLLATSASRIRLRERPSLHDDDQLRAVVNGFAASSNEPPLLSEARRLIRAARETDDIQDTPSL